MLHCLCKCHCPRITFTTIGHRPAKYVIVFTPQCVCACVRGPWAPVCAGPLQNMQVPVVCCRRAHSCLPRILMSTQPFQHIKVPFRRRICTQELCCWNYIICIVNILHHVDVSVLDRLLHPFVHVLIIRMCTCPLENIQMSSFHSYVAKR